MSKYSALELKVFAKIVIADREKDGDKSFRLILVLCDATGLSTSDVVNRIRSYAT